VWSGWRSDSPEMRGHRVLSPQVLMERVMAGCSSQQHPLPTSVQLASPTCEQNQAAIVQTSVSHVPGKPHLHREPQLQLQSNTTNPCSSGLSTALTLSERCGTQKKKWTRTGPLKHTLVGSPMEQDSVAHLSPPATTPACCSWPMTKLTTEDNLPGVSQPHHNRRDQPRSGMHSKEQTKYQRQGE